MDDGRLHSRLYNPLESSNHVCLTLLNYIMVMIVLCVANVHRWLKSYSEHTV